MTTDAIPCGDCGLANPEWASLNRGLLLCEECCFVHRSLGPQYSRVRHFKTSSWHPNLKKMMYFFAHGPANNIWEHNLLDPSKSDKESLTKKPGCNDTLDSKRKFIQLKHFQYQFVLKANLDSFEVRNQELHSTVRTSALDTTLRLLASGADPNFFHPEKGTRPIHVAARNGQALQVELLFLHGAHTDAPDYLGQTPVEHAMAAGHKELAQRILELRYELTDHLSKFVCNETPDHFSAKHIVIPSFKSRNSMQESSIKNLPPHVLEQLAADLYDEVDRRQNEKVLAASGKAKFSIAFLPVDQNYPSVRNQTRQKFARLTDDEVGCLITLVLVESKRRHCNGSPDIEAEKDIFSNCESKVNLQASAAMTEDDDYPLYDSVASDDDLVLAEQQTFLAQQGATLEETTLISSSNVKPVSSCDYSRTRGESSALKLGDSDRKLQDLQEKNLDLENEVRVLNSMISCLMEDHMDLKTSCRLDMYNGNTVGGKLENLNVRLRNSRPSSMCEPKTAVFHQEVTGRPPIHPSEWLRNGQISGVASLVELSTKNLVDYMKKLIEFANSKDLNGITITSRAIYEEIERMGVNIMSMRNVISRKDVKSNLDILLFQALRMKTEISYLVMKSTGCNSSTLYQQARTRCLDVGAALKCMIDVLQKD